MGERTRSLRAPDWPAVARASVITVVVLAGLAAVAAIYRGIVVGAPPPPAAVVGTSAFNGGNAPIAQAGIYSYQLATRGCQGFRLLGDGGQSVALPGSNGTVFLGVGNWVGTPGTSQPTGCTWSVNLALQDSATQTTRGTVDVWLILVAVATAFGAVFVPLGLRSTAKQTGLAAKQFELARRATAIALLAQMIRDWESPEFREKRRDAARGLLEDPLQPSDGWFEVMNWCETLAIYVVDQKTIELRDVWNAASDVVITYVAASSKPIASFREDDNTYFENVLELQALLIAYDAQQRKQATADVTPTEAQQREFLQAEVDRPEDSGPRRLVRLAQGSSIQARVPRMTVSLRLRR